MRDIAQTGIAAIVDQLLAPAGAPGIYARSAVFERVLEGLNALITRNRDASTEVMTFPPITSRQMLEKSGYLKSFPHLLGCVACLHGDEGTIRSRVERNDWVESLGATELVLSPAACYPLYPMVALRGAVANQGATFDVSSYCFRRETTHETGRLQAFRMRELVCVSTPEVALEFREKWVGRAELLAKQLMLPHRIAPASDPFFGRVGKMMAMSQVEQALKFEWLIPIESEERPTACMSFNYHQDHFGEIWDIHTVNGDLAHTTCVAFGLERLTLALFATHGIELRSWPPLVRQTLGV
jgi:seryl-tRNA synthetase